MLKNSYKMLFFFMLILGSLISISSSSWFSIWMGLEINLLSFIPLMMKTNNLFTSEASLKYFLTQALASSTLLFFIIFFSMLTYKNYFKINYLMNILFASSFMLKTGMAPFHFWFPIVMEGLTWMNNLILMTWQKIAPLILLTYIVNYYFFMNSLLFSIIIGSINGLNQTSLRKLMAYSSINHLGWMMAGIMTNQNIWFTYLLFYCFLSMSIIFIFNIFKIFSLNQIFSLLNFKNLIKTTLFIPFLSLGGLPPFLGFFPKWIVIEFLMNNQFIFPMLIMIYFTLITLYFYLRITYSSFLLNYNEMNWYMKIYYFNKKSFSLLSILLFMNIFGLMFINILFLIME